MRYDFTPRTGAVEGVLPSDGFDPNNDGGRRVSTPALRYRDSFAIELLLANVLIGDVSLPLYHHGAQEHGPLLRPVGSVPTNHLAQTVRDTHKRDPLLAELYANPAQEAARGLNCSPGLPTCLGRRDSVRSRNPLISAHIVALRSSPYNVTLHVDADQHCQCDALLLEPGSLRWTMMRRFSGSKLSPSIAVSIIDRCRP